MVDRQHCGACGGGGRIMTLDEPPEDPHSGEGWEECPKCKGTGVEMASRAFEVYVYFQDEVEARAFMDRVADDESVSNYGIRAVEPRKGILGSLGLDDLRDE